MNEADDRQAEGRVSKQQSPTVVVLSPGEREHVEIGGKPRRKGRLGLGRVNAHHERLKTFVNRQARGVSTRYLHLYAGWLRASRRPGFSAEALLADAASTLKENCAVEIIYCLHAFVYDVVIWRRSGMYKLVLDIADGRAGKPPIESTPARPLSFRPRHECREQQADLVATIDFHDTAALKLFNCVSEVFRPRAVGNGFTELSAELLAAASTADSEAQERDDRPLLFREAAFSGRRRYARVAFNLYRHTGRDRIAIFVSA